jgi:hypothetical protein
MREIAIPRITGSIQRPADNTPYSDRDNIGNSGTPGSVLPITFANAGRLQGGYMGRITGCRCVVTPTSGVPVTAGLDFDLWLFRPESNIPFAAGGYPADNAVLNLTSAALKQAVGLFRFISSAWETGASTAVAAYQAQGLIGRPFAPFNLQSIPATSLLGLMQVRNTWTPTGIANTFDFVLDDEQL